MWISFEMQKCSSSFSRWKGLCLLHGANSPLKYKPTQNKRWGVDRNQMTNYVRAMSKLFPTMFCWLSKISSFENQPIKARSNNYNLSWHLPHSPQEHPVTFSIVCILQHACPNLFQACWGFIKFINSAANWQQSYKGCSCWKLFCVAVRTREYWGYTATDLCAFSKGFSDQSCCSRTLAYDMHLFWWTCSCLWWESVWPTGIGNTSRSVWGKFNEGRILIFALNLATLWSVL